jgi:predicted RNA methylase
MNNVKAGHKTIQSYANTRTTGKEQYYTNEAVVDICLDLVKKHIDLKNKTFLEPCGGTGEFIKGLQRQGITNDRIISYDIEPKHHLVVEGNYLETDFSEYSDLVAITNPPFGRASSLAKKFFNHGANHCKYICYLIPKAWRKWTTQNSLDNRFHLIADIEMPKNCFYLPDGSSNAKDVLNTVFQIWERREYKRKKIKIPDHGLFKKILPTTDTSGKKIIKGANFELIIFGYSAGKVSDITKSQVPYKTTTMYMKIDRQDVKDAFKKIDLSIFYNNVSYVQALSIQEINYALNEWFGLPNFNLGIACNKQNSGV